MAVGSTFQSESSRFQDKETGYTIIRPIREDQNRQMYFTSNPFTKDGDHLIFSGIREGTENFYLLNYLTGKYTQLTDNENLVIAKAHYDKTQDTLYYTEPNKIFSVHTQTLETKLVYQSETELGSLGATCDGKYLVSSAYIQLVRKNNDQQNMYLDLYRMFKIDLSTGEESTILYRSAPLDHIQCSPTDPDSLLYCGWGYLCTHQRIWGSNLDGTKGGPVGPEMPNEHRVHEYYTPDGKQIAYHGKFYSYDNQANFKNIGHTWGLMNVDGTEDVYWHCRPKGHQAGHSIISHDQTMIVADGDNNISFIHCQDDGTAIFEKIAAHNSTMSGNFVHPHPSFSGDDRYIVFASDMGGENRGNIYIIDLQSKEDKK